MEVIFMTRVKVNGVEYKSVVAAFVALGLPLGRHQRFRIKLKKDGKAEINGHLFEVV
jgi:hypothetical protein